MSLFLFKSILGVVFLAAAVTDVISMLTLMGRQKKKVSSKRLRKIHRAAGYTFFILSAQKEQKAKGKQKNKQKGSPIRRRLSRE